MTDINSYDIFIYGNIAFYGYLIETKRCRTIASISTVLRELIMQISEHYHNNGEMMLFHGDCLDLFREIPNNSVSLIVTSPPYCMKKAYEDPTDDINTFIDIHTRIISEIYRVLKPGGSVCWQVGYHVADSEIVPLDYIIYNVFSKNNTRRKYPFVLRNRIIWTFGHGLNCTQRFSGRHEMIMWFTKGQEYTFDLDSVRVPQKYPGKRYYKGEKKGELSGNPLGKNPSDVWDIPNVKANHIEKTEHPCQFPVAIPQRLIRSLTNKGDLVMDPFMGSGTTALASLVENRRFIGSELQDEYYEIAVNRINDAKKGKIKIREDKPVTKPNANTAVAKLPDEFRDARKNKQE